MTSTSETSCDHQDSTTTNSGSAESKIKRNKTLKGFIFAFLSGTCYALTSVIVKQVKNIHAGQVSLYRFIGIWFVSFPAVIWCQHNVLGPKESRLFMFFRGIFGTMNIFFQYAALQYLPLGEATAIIFCSPALTGVLGRIFLKETCGLLQSVTVLLSVFGIFLITKIPTIFSSTAHRYTEENVFGILAALGAMLSASVQYIMLRKLRTVNNSVLMFNFSWVGILSVGCVTFATSNFAMHHCGYQQFFLILLVFLGYSAQHLITMALQYDEAGTVAVVRSASDLILSFLSQTFIFGDVPDVYSICGAITIGSSIMLIGLKNWILKCRSSQKC